MRKSKTTSLFSETNPFNFETWIKQVVTDCNAREKKLLQQAYVLANFVGANRTTPSGLSCLNQGLITAEILAELKIDADCLAAAICYPSVQYAELSLEDISEQLNPNVAELIKGTQRMEVIHSLHENVNRSRHLIENSIDTENLLKVIRIL